MRKIVWVFNSVFGLMEVVEAQAAYLVLGEQRALLQADDRHVRRPRNLSGGKMIFRLGCFSSDETKTNARHANQFYTEWNPIKLKVHSVKKNVVEEDALTTYLELKLDHTVVSYSK